MNAAPRLSIGLPVYNGEKYLAESLDALLGQSYGDYELIISDNASTDSTQEICRRVPGPRLADQLLPAAGQHRRHAEPQLDLRAVQRRAVQVGVVRRPVRPGPAAALHRGARRRPGAGPGARLPGDHRRQRRHRRSRSTTRSTPTNPHAPERFRSLLFAVGGDDFYGVMRSDILRRTPLNGSYHHSDRTIMAELALYGRFHQVPELLFFRRDHPDRAERAKPTIRSRVGEHGAAAGEPAAATRPSGCSPSTSAASSAAIRRAPLSSADRRGVLRPPGAAGWPAAQCPARRGRIEDSAPADAADRDPGRAPRSPGTGGCRRNEHAGTAATDRRSSACWDPATSATTGRSTRCCGSSGREHPEAEISCVAPGPRRCEQQYGIPSRRHHLVPAARSRPVRLTTVALKMFGKVADLVRMPRLVRRYDIVIVPGHGRAGDDAGAAAVGLAVRAVPDVVCRRGSAGAKIAFVSVGANVARERSIRWLFIGAARAGVVPLVPRRLLARRDAADGPRHQSGRGLSRPRLRAAADRPDRRHRCRRDRRAHRRPRGDGVPRHQRRPGPIRARSTRTTAGRSSSSPRWLVDEGYRIRLRHRRPVRRGGGDGGVRRPAADPAGAGRRRGWSGSRPSRSAS